MIFNRVWLEMGSRGVKYYPTEYTAWYVYYNKFTSPKRTVMLAVL